MASQTATGTQIATPVEIMICLSLKQLSYDN